MSYFSRGNVASRGNENFEKVAVMYCLRFIRYICYLNPQFLNIVIIIQTKIVLPAGIDDHS